MLVLACIPYLHTFKSWCDDDYNPPGWLEFKSKLLGLVPWCSSMGSTYNSGNGARGHPGCPLLVQLPDNAPVKCSGPSDGAPALTWEIPRKLLVPISGLAQPWLLWPTLLDSMFHGKDVEKSFYTPASCWPWPMRTQASVIQHSPFEKHLYPHTYKVPATTPFNDAMGPQELALHTGFSLSPP